MSRVEFITLAALLTKSLRSYQLVKRDIEQSLQREFLAPPPLTPVCLSGT